MSAESRLRAVPPSSRSATAAAPRWRRLLTGRGRLRGARKWFVLLLFVLPTAAILLKLSGTAPGQWLDGASSLAGLDGRTGHRIASVLLVPLAAVIVVFFRVSLGIRVLGPFRSFLLAVAFQATGIRLGILFLAFALTVIVAIRGPMKSIRLPYYGRVSVVMSTVAALMALALVIGRSVGIETLGRVAYFPIVALCLMGDAFATTIRREGWRSAVWRVFATTAVAVLIAGIAGIPGFESAIVRFPELLVLEIGMIIVIAEFFGYRALSSLNPPPIKKRRGRKAKKKATARSAAPTPVTASAVAGEIARFDLNPDASVTSDRREGARAGAPAPIPSVQHH